MGRLKRTKEDIQKDIESQSKVCCVCENRKPFEDFYNMTNKNDQKSYRCKPCDDDARRFYYSRNVDTAKALARNRALKFKYGITQADYERKLAEQGGGCAICESKETRGKHSFSVDHCHKTGNVRGLLCNNCNRAIGLLSDDLSIVYSAAHYLEKYEIH